MDRFRRSVKLPITITHSRSHHRAVNKIISTTLGMNNRDRTPRSRPVPARVRRAAAINHGNKEAPTSRINCQASFTVFDAKECTWDESLISKPAFLDWHFTTVPRWQDILNPRRPFSRSGHAADSEARFLLRIKIRRGQTLSIDQNYNRDVK